MSKVKLFVALLTIQYQFMTCMAPFQALVTGLGYGKTFIGARKAVFLAKKFKGRKGLAAANSYRQLEDVVIPELHDALRQMHMAYTWVAGKSRFELANGSMILCRSLEKTSSEKLRGIDFAWAWLDEARDMPLSAFQVVQGRVGRRLGSQTIVYLTTTPKGFNWIYKLFGPKRKNKKDYVLFRATTRDNPALNPDYADGLEDSYDESMKRQEVDGDFVAEGKTLYHAWSSRNESAKAKYRKGDRIIVALDFNVIPCTAAIIQERQGFTLVVDEIYDETGMGTEGVINTFLERYPEAKGVQVYGDPAGHARDTRSKTTDFEMWKQRVDCRIYVAKSWIHISDRINAVNGRLRSYTKKVRLLVNPKCEHLIEDFQQVKPHKDGSKRPRKETDTPHLTHISDAVGYYVVSQFPIHKKLDREALAASDAAW